MTEKAVSERSVKFQEPDDFGSEIGEDEKLSRQFNKFQLLETIENNENSSASDCEQDKSDSQEEEQDEKEKQNKTKTTTATANSSRRRPKKRRNKAKQKGPSIDELLDINENNSAEQRNLGDRSDRSNSNSRYQLLRLDVRHLNPENELVRMFGKDVLRQDKSDKSGKSAIPTNVNSRSRFAPGNSEFRLMMPGSSIKMEPDEVFNGQTIAGANAEQSAKKDKRSSRVQDDQPIYFKFVHERDYQVAQTRFLEAAHIGLSDQVVGILAEHPSHIESIIQLSDMVRVSEDYKTASEFVERALLIFERAFHPRFEVLSGRCRISYKRPENRTFFITIFKHIQYCNRRGLRRTPLEYTKLLLSLDPDNDPLFATLMLDFFALRSEQYDYLIEFISKWQHLAKLPNMNFSLALAHFMKSRSAKMGPEAMKTSAKLADECLQKALMRYPNFIIKLLEACQGEPDSDLKKCDYFDYSVYGRRYNTAPESVDLLVSLYVERSGMLWKLKPVMTWLESNTAILVKQFASGDIVDRGQNVEYWSTLKGPAPRTLLRHLVLADLKVKVPMSVSHAAVLDIDPYPPESIVSYDSRGASQTANSIRNHGTGSSGISGLFLRSIFPSFSLETDQQPPQPPRDE